MRLKILARVFAVIVIASSAQAAGTFYTSESSFTLALNPTFYLEDFSSFTFGNPLNGSQTTYVAPGANGYGWTASATLGLYSNQSALSTNSANDPITITFSGLTVTALGGIFANTDINGNIIPGTISITTTDGGNQMFTMPADGFIGYTSTAQILSVTFDATSGATNNWVQLDHFYTGMALAVPEPATSGLATFGLGTILLFRKRLASKQERMS